MNIMIVDDDNDFINQLATDLFKNLHAEKKETNIITINKDFEEVFRYKSYAFDLGFIDIEMGDVDGIKLAKKIKDLNICDKVIFISSHTELVFDALTIQPLFFLRKMEYAIDYHKMIRIIKEIFIEEGPLQLIYNGNSSLVKKNEIVYVESQDHLLVIHTGNREINSNKSLKEFLLELNDNRFVQIHKSYVINLECILLYDSCNVNLIQNIQLPIGRKFRKEFVDSYRRRLLS